MEIHGIAVNIDMAFQYLIIPKGVSPELHSETRTFRAAIPSKYTGTNRWPGVVLIIPQRIRPPACRLKLSRHWIGTAA